MTNYLEKLYVCVYHTKILVVLNAQCRLEAVNRPQCPQVISNNINYVCIFIREFSVEQNEERVRK